MHLVPLGKFLSANRWIFLNIVVQRGKCIETTLESLAAALLHAIGELRREAAK
jgi:hypothetical protein